MRIYLASKRRLAVSAAALAVGSAVLIPATAMATGRHHSGPTTWSPAGGLRPRRQHGPRRDRDPVRQPVGHRGEEP